MELIFDDHVPTALEQTPDEPKVKTPHAAIAIRMARAKLTVAPRTSSIWPVLAAAALAAATALGLALAIIIGLPKL